MLGPGEGVLAPIFWNYAGSRVTQRILILKKDRPKTLCKIEAKLIMPLRCFSAVFQKTDVRTAANVDV